MPEHYDQPEFRQTPYWASDTFWLRNDKQTVNTDSLPNYLGMQLSMSTVGK